MQICNEMQIRDLVLDFFLIFADDWLFEFNISLSTTTLEMYLSQHSMIVYHNIDSDTNPD